MVHSEFQDRCLKPLGHPSGAEITTDFWRAGQASLNAKSKTVAERGAIRGRPLDHSTLLYRFRNDHGWIPSCNHWAAEDPESAGSSVMQALQFDLDNDGQNLVVRARQLDLVDLRIAIPWREITNAVASDLKAYLSDGDVIVSFVGSTGGMHFSLRDMVEIWIDGYDPADPKARKEHDALLASLRDCLKAIEETPEN